jgi:hypothetical protein
MKNTFASLMLLVQKIDRQYFQLALVILALVMLALGTGAPLEGGGGR